MAPPFTPEPGSNRKRTNTGGSAMSAAGSVRNVGASLLSRDLPHGFLAATAEVGSKAPTVADIRRGSFGHEGWNERGQYDRRRSSASEGRPGLSRRTSSGLSEGSGRKGRAEEAAKANAAAGSTVPFPALTEEPTEASRSMELQRRSREAEAREEVEEELVDPLDESRGNGTVAPIVAEKAYKKEPISEVREKKHRHHHHDEKHDPEPLHPRDRANSSGYIPPPKIPWTTSTLVGTKTYLKWVCTPFGFLITAYGLNVVAWGGMLFLLLCGAAPAMCSQDKPSNNFDGCNDIDSSRRIWIETDSQILNALFCVTGFGLIPWRFRDLWYLLRWRMCSEKKYGREQKLYGLRVLGGIHRNWFRLPGSDTLDQQTAAEFTHDTTRPPTTDASSSIKPSKTDSIDPELGLTDPRLPLPLSKIPSPPLTGVRAPPTPTWKLDFFIWMQVWNTFFQACLAGFMWGLNRYDRPSWSTGLFVALACGVAGAGGLVSFLEGKKVKRVEGVGEEPTPGEAAVEGEEKDVEANRMRVERTGQGVTGGGAVLLGMGGGASG